MDTATARIKTWPTIVRGTSRKTTPMCGNGYLLNGIAHKIPLGGKKNVLGVKGKVRRAPSGHLGPHVAAFAAALG